MKIGTGNRNKTPANIIMFVFLYFLIFSSSVNCYIFSISHFPPSKKADIFLLITDLSGVGPNVKISFYDDLGIEVSALNKLLPPNGKIQLKLDDYIKKPGTITIESTSKQISGEYWYIPKKGFPSVLNLQSPTESNRYLVNCYNLSFCERTLIVISDPIGNGPMVQMEFYSKTGELIKVARKLLRPLGLLVIKIDDYAPADVIGKVSVRSFGGGITLHSQILCDKGMVFLMPPSKSSKSLFITGLQTGKKKLMGLIISDATGKAPSVSIKAMNQEGYVVYEQEESLPSNGTILIEILEFAGSNSEVASIELAGSSEMIATYWESDTNIDRVILEPCQKCSSEHIAALSYLPIFGSSIAKLSLLNPNNASINVDIYTYRSDGSKVAGDKFTIGPYKCLDRTVSSHLRDLPGTIVVAGSGLVAGLKIVSTKDESLLCKIYAFQ